MLSVQIIFGTVNLLYDFAMKSLLLSAVHNDGIHGAMNSPLLWAFLAWLLSRFLVTFRIVTIDTGTDTGAAADWPLHSFELARVTPVEPARAALRNRLKRR